jgi:hypothetical protein
MEDFSRLKTSWAEWAPASGLQGVSVSTECPDCQIGFLSREFSVHLRHEGEWWLVDTVDERGDRSDGDAKLSAFSLVEKYLIWDWISTARPRLASGRLGADLYRQGYAPGISVADLDGAHIELSLQGNRAILISGTAKIFSHIMLMSLDEIEQIGRQGGR